MSNARIIELMVKLFNAAAADYPDLGDKPVNELRKSKVSDLLGNLKSSIASLYKDDAEKKTACTGQIDRIKKDIPDECWFSAQQVCQHLETALGKFDDQLITDSLASALNDDDLNPLVRDYLQMDITFAADPAVDPKPIKDPPATINKTRDEKSDTDQSNAQHLLDLLDGVEQNTTTWAFNKGQVQRWIRVVIDASNFIRLEISCASISWLDAQPTARLDQAQLNTVCTQLLEYTSQHGCDLNDQAWTRKNEKIIFEFGFSFYLDSQRRICVKPQVKLRLP